MVKKSLAGTPALPVNGGFFAAVLLTRRLPALRAKDALKTLLFEEEGGVAGGRRGLIVALDKLASMSKMIIVIIR
jgi:hypothetical protein